MYLQLFHEVCLVSAATPSSQSCTYSYSIKSIKSVMYLQLFHQVCPVSAATPSSLSCTYSYSIKSVESILYLQLLCQVFPLSAATHDVCQVGPLFAVTPLYFSSICSYFEVYPVSAVTPSSLSCKQLQQIISVKQII